MFTLKCGADDCGRTLVTLELGTMAWPGRKPSTVATYVEGVNHPGLGASPSRPQVGRLDYVYQDTDEMASLRHVHRLTCSCGADIVMRDDTLVRRCAAAEADGSRVVFTPGRGR